MFRSNLRVSGISHDDGHAFHISLRRYVSIEFTCVRHFTRWWTRISYLFKTVCFDRIYVCQAFHTMSSSSYLVKCEIIWKSEDIFICEDIFIWILPYGYICYTQSSSGNSDFIYWLGSEILTQDGFWWWNQNMNWKI